MDGEGWYVSMVSPLVGTLGFSTLVLASLLLSHCLVSQCVFEPCEGEAGVVFGKFREDGG